MSLFSALQVSASGMQVQRTRAQLLVENMANSETTRTPEGGPYKRKDANLLLGNAKLAVWGCLSERTFKRGHGIRCRRRRSCSGAALPSRHPDADANGYVAFPRMNPAEEMTDLMNASQSYQANVAAMSAVKDMISHSLDIMR